EPVTAAALSTAYRIRKFIRRHRTVVGFACAIVLLLMAGISVSSWLAAVATRARDDEARAKHQVQLQLAQTEQALRAAEFARNAESLRRHEQLPQALKTIEQALSLEPSNGMFWEAKSDILRQSDKFDLTNPVVAYTREIDLLTKARTAVVPPDAFLKRAL